MENAEIGARVAPESIGSTSRLAKLSHLYDGLVRWSLVVLFALTPLFFLPFTIDALEINKQTLLVILTSLAALAWLGQMVSRKELTFRKGWLNAFPAFVWLTVLISSILAKASFLAFVGQATQEYQSFLTMSAFVVLFYLLVNTVNDAKTERCLFETLLISSAVLAIFFALEVLGVKPLSFLGITSPYFNPVGATIGAGVYLTVATLFGNGLWLTDRSSRRQELINKVATLVLSLSTLFVLIAIDYWVLWVLMLIGVAILFAFSTLRATEFPETGKFVLPMALLVVSLLLLFLPSPLHLNVPVEIGLSHSASWSVATKTLSGPGALFGTGPGTFIFDYGKYRSTDLNPTAFWATRFDRGSSYLLTVLPTIGIVGLLALLALLIAFAVRGVNRLIAEQNQAEWKMHFVLFAPWLTMVAAMALYPFNLSLQFLFWALTGLLGGRLMLQKKTLAFQKSPRTGLGLSFLFVLVAIGIVTGLFVTGERYAAEIAYAKAVAVDQAGGSVDDIIADISTAVRHNSLNDVYERSLAQALLVKTQQEITAAGNPVPDDKAKEIQGLIVDTVKAAQTAVALSPNDVANWEMLGNIYREVSPVVGGADEQAIQAFNKAIELGPTNPAEQTALAEAYVVFSETARGQTASTDPATAEAAKTALSTDLQAAEKALLAAVGLKGDYAPAHYYLAVVYERQGRLADAVSKMEAVKQYNPLDVGVAFQLGLLYLREGKYPEAQAELERAVQLTPNYANARWFLAAIYEKDGLKDKAIEQVQKVLELNPDNELVKAKLERLQKGQLSKDVIPEPVESSTGSVLSGSSQTP